MNILSVLQNVYMHTINRYDLIIAF